MGKFKGLFRRRKRRPIKSKSADDLIAPPTPIPPQTASIFQMKRQLQMKCSSFVEYSRLKMRRMKRKRSSESIRAVHSDENITLSDSESEEEIDCHVTIQHRTSSRHIELHLSKDILRLRLVAIVFFFTLIYVIFALPILLFG